MRGYNKNRRKEELRTDGKGVIGKRKIMRDLKTGKEMQGEYCIGTHRRLKSSVVFNVSAGKHRRKSFLQPHR